MAKASATQQKIKANTKAVLTMRVEFDDFPVMDEIERILDEARSYGHVTDADLEVMQPSKRSVL